MFNKKNDSTRNPASKSGEKGPRAYQGYIIALIILIMIVFYSFMYW